MSNPPDRSADSRRQPELSIDAHRGIFVPGDYYASNAGLGVHWSASKKVAEEMGTYAWHDRATSGIITHPKDKIVVYTAEIPISSVETDKSVLKKNKVLSIDDFSKNSEKEVPVKKGATILLKSTSATKTSNHSGYRTRTRTYNPPKEVQA